MEPAQYANGLITTEAFSGGSREEEYKDSEALEEEATSYFKLDEGFSDEKVDPFVTYRIQTVDSELRVETVDSSNSSQNNQQEQEHEEESEKLPDLAEFAELAVARMVADQRAKILKNHLSKENTQESSKDESCFASEPPSIARVPDVSKLPECTFQSNPPANLVIQPLQAQSTPLVSQDDMSDITPMPYEEGIILSIFPVEKQVDHEEGDRVALVIGTRRSEDLGYGDEEPLGATTQSDAKRSRWKYWVLVVLLTIFVLCAAGYLIVYVLEYAKSSINEGNDLKIILGDGGHSTDTIPLTGMGSKQTTMMDPHQPGCTFENSTQPHVLGQCLCNGEVSILTNELREKYYAVNTLFVSLNVSDGWDLPENSCDPRNQAKVWVASTFPTDRNDLIQKYALALFYIQMTGHEWVHRIGWLDDGDTCSWSGISCNENGNVRDLVLDGNNLKGTVSAAVCPSCFVTPS
jgi:hypothetical protein